VAIDDLLAAIRPHLAPGSWVGAVPGYGGFDWRARRALGSEVPLFGLQRVPYVRKTVAYGEVVWISGIRPRLYVAALPAARVEEIAASLEQLLSIPTTPLASYLSVNLSTSNPTFHPARIYTALGGASERKLFNQCDRFYEDWDQAASDAFLALDRELATIAERFPRSLGGVVPIFKHYGARDAAELTVKIRSIRALRDRLLPLVRTAGGWRADTFSPFFTEDIPYGLLTIRGIAEIVDVPTPTMDAILQWAGSMTSDVLLDASGRIPHGTPYPVPRRFGLNSVDALVTAAV
jgi:opine dehydrogenase